MDLEKKINRTSFLQKAKNSLAARLFSYALATSATSTTSCGGTSPDRQQSSYVQQETRTTDREGEVTFNNGVAARIENEEGDGLRGITVHYLHKEDKNTLLAVDPEGNYYPERNSFLSETERREGGVAHFGLQSTIILALQNVRAGMELVESVREESGRSQRGDVLGEGQDVNKYCLTLEQITANNIDVPAGLVLLPVSAQGKLGDVIARLLKIAITTPIRIITERYIISEYGKQAGYEVWVPKTQQSICGEEYTGTVCSLDNRQLERVWNPELPYWRINGECTPREQSEKDSERDDDDNDGPCNNSPLYDNYLWNVARCGTGTTNPIGENCQGVYSLDDTGGRGNYKKREMSVSGDMITIEGRGTFELARDFSQSEIATAEDLSVNYPTNGTLCEAPQNESQYFDAYRCALNEDQGLYVFKNKGTVCLNDNLWRITNEPWLSGQDCWKQERAKAWFKSCFEDEGLDKP